MDVDGLGWVGALVQWCIFLFSVKIDLFLFFVFSDIVVMAVEFFFSPFNWKPLCLISCKFQ